jgi:hypothetical protein
MESRWVFVNKKRFMQSEKVCCFFRVFRAFRGTHFLVAARGCPASSVAKEYWSLLWAVF